MDATAGSVTAKLSIVALLVATTFTALSPARAAQPIPFGVAEDGTHVVLQAPAGTDRDRVINAIRQANASRPRNAEEFVHRMKRSCLGKRSGLVAGAVGGAVMFGKEFFEEIPQEFSGDALGFAGAQLFAGPEEPGWMVHWSENVISGDFLAQIGIAVAAQTSITQMAAGLMSDVCNYYLLPNKRKVPIPMTDADGNFRMMTVDEQQAVRKIYKRVRARRALVNGGAMGVGMVLGRFIIEAKNDVDLRKCAAQSMTKRWGEASDFVQHQRACETAARKWFSKTKAGELNAAIISSLISGVGTYAVREAGEAAIIAGTKKAIAFSSFMDRNMLLKSLASKALQRDLSRRAIQKGVVKTVKIVVRSIKMMRSTVKGNFAIEVILEAGTGFVAYWAEEHIVRPVINPYFQKMSYQSQMGELLTKLQQSTNVALSPNQKYTYMYQPPTRFGSAMVPVFSRPVESALPPVEDLITEIAFTNSQWKETIAFEANEIRQNWMDVVKYPDNVMNSAHKLYSKLIELGSHDTLMPSPHSWDFFSNPQSIFKKQALDAIKTLEPKSQKLDNIIGEVFVMLELAGNLQSAEGREKLINEHLISREFANRVADPVTQKSLAADLKKILEAGYHLCVALQIPQNCNMAPADMKNGLNQQQNVIKGLEILLSIVNNPNSIFAFPAVYRSTEANPGGFFSSIGDDLVAAVGNGNKAANHCNQKNSRGQDLVKGFFWRGQQFNTKWPYYLCDGNDRYGFATGVYPNRIYRALSKNIGYPFKLRPRVEDLELILSKEDGSLFQENDLTDLAPVGFAYGTDHAMREVEELHSSDGFSTVTREVKRMPIDEIYKLAGDGPLTLRTKLDLFVNRLLCGPSLDKKFFADNDIAVLKDLRKEGLRLTTGLPRIAVELDGISAPLVCEMDPSGQTPKGMNFQSYVDYFSRDLERPGSASSAPERHKLVYGSSTPIAYREGKDFISKAYSDFLELASRRIDPEFLKAPEEFEKLWEDKISKHYNGFIQSREYQKRYEAAIKKTVDTLGIIWRRAGDVGKCEFLTVIKGGCGTSNIYKPDDLINARVNTFAAFHWLEPGSPLAKQYESRLNSNMDVFVKNTLDKPFSAFQQETGRGLYASSSAEVNLAIRYIWQMAKYYERTIKQKDPKAKTEASMAKIKTHLRRISIASELVWQFIDENTPTSNATCPPQLRKVGCTASRMVTVELVKAYLTSFTSKRDREEYRSLENIIINGYRELGLGGADLNVDEPISVTLENLANIHRITPENPFGLFAEKFPNIMADHVRNDTFFRIARASIMISLQKELYGIARSTYDLRVISRKLGVVSNETELVNFTNEKGMLGFIRSTFEGSLNQLSVFDAFKNGEGEKQQVKEEFAELEQTTLKIKGYFDRASNFNYMPCDRRLLLDNLYKARPDLSRSVDCAVEAKKLDLSRDAIEKFERNFTITIAPPTPPPVKPQVVVVTGKRLSKSAPKANKDAPKATKK